MKRTMQTTVEIFRTDVSDNIAADCCILALSRHWPDIRFNFDLEDRDRILRAEGYHINTGKIIEVLSAMQVRCSLYPG